MRSFAILVVSLGGIVVGLFSLGLGAGRVYKIMVGVCVLERGRAARLARGAHNPKVGSSNLPPATISRAREKNYLFNNQIYL
jgi:hypothetical protein